jgi:tetratricopeptide (TPR) repeat protein
MRVSIKIKILVIFMACVILSQVFSSEISSGSSSGAFLLLGLGARSAGMGYAYTAVGEDIDSLFWNPAGLGDIPNIQLTTTYTQWFQGISNQYVAGSFPFGKYGTLSGEGSLYRIGDIEVRDDKGDNSPDRIGDANSFYFGGSYAIKLGKYFSIGTTFKYIHSNIVDESASAYAFDLGLLFDSPLSVGFVIKNFGTKLKYIDKGYPLPLMGRLGTALKLLDNNLIIATDIEYTREKNFAIYSGVEWTLANTITPRFGYIFDRESIANGYTFGVGVSVMGLSIDYALVPYGELGMTNRVSVGYAFGTGRERMSEKIEKLAAEELAKKEKLMSELLYETGLSYYNEGNYEDAINAWDLTLIWDPEHQNAVQWIEKARDERVVEQIEKHIKRGKDFKEFERYTEAIHEWQKALELDPSNAEVQALMVEAEEELIRRQRLKQEKIQVLSEEAIDLYKRGNFKGAIDRWQEILYLDPTNSDARMSLEDAQLRVKQVIDDYISEAQRYENVGNWSSAVKTWRKVLDLDPTHEIAKDGEKRAMEELAEQVNGLISIGVNQYEKGELEKAEATFLKVLELSPSNNTAENYLGEIRQKYALETDEKEEDIDYYQVYLSGINAYTSHNYKTAVNLWSKIPPDNSLYGKAQANIKRAKDILEKIEG